MTALDALREALEAWDQTLNLAPTPSGKWASARSRIVDELVAVDGSGPAARWRDPGVPKLAAAALDTLRAQRFAECGEAPTCPSLARSAVQSATDVLDNKLLPATLDLLEVILRDEPARREIGRLVAYMTREGSGLGGTNAAPSSRPFATSQARAPGALDTSTVALVDGLGALGDLTDVRAFYPMVAAALDDLDPQLALLSQLSARAYDGEGHELCSKELDPEEVVRSSLARLSLPVTPPGGTKRTALQIILDAIADVNRVKPDQTGPLAPADYGRVFGNVHELLTDPEGGLEQLYASVKAATEN